MPTITASPGLVIDLLPHGASDDHAAPGSRGGTAVRIRRTGDGFAVVVYLPEVRGLLAALAAVAAETATLVVQGEKD